ncbi:hypothetical protein DJ68_18685, partial [Halorubrum sp. C3]
MHERVAHLREDRPVELDVVALDLEVDPLVEVPRDVADEPRERVGHLRERDEPHVHRRVLQAGGELVELVERVRLGVRGLQLPPELDPARHQLLDEPVQLVDLVDVDADRLDLVAGLGVRLRTGIVAALRGRRLRDVRTGVRLVVIGIVVIGLWVGRIC